MTHDDAARSHASACAQAYRIYQASYRVETGNLTYVDPASGVGDGVTAGRNYPRESVTPVQGFGFNVGDGYLAMGSGLNDIPVALSRNPWIIG